MIAVLDTGIANAASVLYAIERIGYAAVLTDDPEKLLKSSHVILPGVGTASALLRRLQSQELKACIRDLTQPVLGICLGMQVLYDFSEEGNTSCLGVFNGSVRRLNPSGNSFEKQSGNLPVPHMGWNQVKSVRDSQLLKGVPEESYFYFVHSFCAPIQTETVAITEYGENVAAVVESDQWFGTQFHPERSGLMGEKVIKNFLSL